MDFKDNYLKCSIFWIFRQITVARPLKQALHTIYSTIRIDLWLCELSLYDFVKYEVKNKWYVYIIMWKPCVFAKEIKLI